MGKRSESDTGVRLAASDRRKHGWESAEDWDEWFPLGGWDSTSPA